MHPTEAAHAIAAYNEEGHAILRDHQQTVFEATSEHFASGHTGGNIVLPPGAGKSVLITEFVAANPGARRILNISPTQDILRQTHARGEQLRGMPVMTNYYAHEKDATGQTINTTPASAEIMIRDGVIDPAEVDLVLYDELHTALGEKRFGLLNQFPNALFVGLTATPDFKTFNALKKAGKITGDEPWCDMFTRTIHEVSIEEGMEMGMLAPADIHLLRTYVRVPQARVNASGNYSSETMNRYINVRNRNALSLALVAGPESLPEGVRLLDATRDEVSQLHEKIQGKRTMVFCPSVANADYMAAEYQKAGIPAVAIHGQVAEAKRRQYFQLHRMGHIQVLCGVDLMRVGIDCPETEVGIYADPTQSYTVATQEFGRILRTSEGKERAIAIQLVDAFSRPSERPILLPDLFESNVFARARDRKLSSKEPTGPRRERADNVQLFAGEVAARAVHTTSEHIIRARLAKSADYQEVEDIMTQAVKEVAEGAKEPMTDLQFARRLADATPTHIPEAAQAHAVNAMAATADQDMSRRAQVTMVLLNMKSLLSATDLFLADERSAAEREAMFAYALAEVTEQVTRISPDSSLPVAQDIYRFATGAIVRYIANREQVPVGWVRGRKYGPVIRAVTAYFSQERSSQNIKTAAAAIAKTHKVAAKTVEAYMLTRLHEPYDEEDTSLSDVANDAAQQRETRTFFRGLDDREKAILERRFGLDGGKPASLEDTGIEHGVTRERIRQIEAKALAKVRFNLFTGRYR